MVDSLWQAQGRRRARAGGFLWQLPVLLVASGGAACLDATVPGTPDSGPVDSQYVTFAAEGVYFGAAFSQSPIPLTDNNLKAFLIDPTAAGGLRQLTVSFTNTMATCELPLGSSGVWQLNMPPPFFDFPYFFPITDRTREWRTLVQAASGPQPTAVAPTNAAIDLNIALSSPYVAGDHFSVTAAGPWSAYNFPAATRPAAGAIRFDPTAVAYSQFAALGRFAFPTVTANDRMYVNRHRAGRLVGTRAVPSFDLVAGVNTIAESEVAVAASESIQASAVTQFAISRFGRFRVAGDGLSVFWQLNASTDSPYNTYYGVQLDSATMDTVTGAINAAFGNPFPELRPLLGVYVHHYRVETDPNGQEWRHYTGFQSHDREPTNGRIYSHDQGLPLTISINGVLLSADKQQLALPRNQPIELSFTADREGGELRQIDCYRFDQNPQRYTLVLSVRVPVDRARIPAEVFPRDARYFCRALVLAGIPNAGTGDDLTRGPLRQTAFHDSPSFIVQ